MILSGAYLMMIMRYYAILLIMSPTIGGMGGTYCF